MERHGILERAYSLVALLLVVALLLTPTISLASDGSLATPEQTTTTDEVVDGPGEDVEEAPTQPTTEGQLTEPPAEEVGETPVEPSVEQTDVEEVTEEVGDTPDESNPEEVEAQEIESVTNTTDLEVVGNNIEEPAVVSPQTRNQPMQQQVGNLTLYITSSDPDVAPTIGTTSTWSVSTRSNGRVLYINSSGRDLSLPMTLTSSWLNNVPTGEAIITVDGGPQFQVWSQPVDIAGGAQTVNVELQVLPAEQIISGTFAFTFASANPEVLGTLPVSTTFQVYDASGTRVFYRAGLSTSLPNTVQVPANTGGTLAYGEYRVVVTPPSGFQSETLYFTLSQPNQAETITLRPIAAVETYTGTVLVHEPTTLSTRPLANATVTLDSGAELVTGTDGNAVFADLEAGDYAVTVAAADGRTGGGTLVIDEADGDVQITLDAISANLTVTIDACPQLPSTLAAGDPVEINYTVTNDGNVNMVNSRGRVFKLSTRNYAYAPVDQIPSPLAPGESANVTVTYRVDQTELDAGHLRANASVSSTRPPFGQNTSFSASLNDCLVEQPVSLTGTITVVDADGETPVPGVNVAVTGMDAPETTGEDGTVTFNDLEDGTYPVTAEAPDGRIVTGDLQIAGASASITLQLPEIVTALSISLTCPEIAGAPAIGDEITITFDVTNDGNVHITNLRGSVWQNGTNTRIDSNPPMATSLKPGESSQVVVSYTLVFADTNRGQIYGRAQASGQRPNGSNIVARENLFGCTFQQHEDFTVVATSPVVPEDIAVGDEITIPVVVTNTGSTNLERARVSNDRDAEVGQLTTLGPGRDGTYTYTTEVTGDDLTNGRISVEFTVVSGQPKGTSPTRTVGVNVALPTVDEEDLANVTINVVSADPDIANVLPADATWTVSFEGQEIASDTFATEHLSLPATIVVENPVAFGDYELSINAGPTFEPVVSEILSVNQPNQVLTVELQPVAPVEEAHTGTIRVVEADTTTPVVGATVSIFGNDDASAILLTVFGHQSTGGAAEWGTPLVTGVTDANGEVVFDALQDGVYDVAVEAADGRTGTGSLSISGGNSSVQIVMQAQPTDPVEPPVTETPGPTDPVEPPVTETPEPTDPVEPPVTETPEPTDPAQPTETPRPTDPAGDTPVTRLPETGHGAGPGNALYLIAATLGVGLIAAAGLRIRRQS